MNQPFPLMYNRTGPIKSLSLFHQFYENGVRIFHIDATCSEDIYHPELRAWVKASQFDYSAQERGWEQWLACCPEGRLCLRVYVASPPWWDEENPGELQRYADGRSEHNFLWTSRRTLPSLASQLWQQDAAASLERFLGWLDSSGWAQKIWGLHLSYGITWEWGLLGSDDFLDYSQPMRQRFQQWLKDFYGSAHALGMSWGLAGLSFESVEIPLPQARLRADGDFRVFPRDRPAYDFQRCLSDSNADYLLLLARTVREHAGDRYALGAFYGYTLTAREHSAFMGQLGSGGLQGGHHALARILDSRLFNYLASPYVYANRDLGQGLLIQHYPLRTLQERGIHGYEENDLRSFTNPPRSDSSLSLGHTTTRRESILHQRLALVQALCRGTSYWWTDLVDPASGDPDVSNFSDAEIVGELRRHQELFERLNQEGFNRSAAQIALVLDEEAMDALGLNSHLFLREVYEQLPHWGWCGAPFDVWLASDIPCEAMTPYRLVYVFAPYWSSGRRKSLQDTLCRSGRTVWWGPAAGALTDKGFDPASFAELTGFPSPDVAVSTPVRQERKGWISIYGSCAGQSSAQLASIAQEAGVHLYGPPPLQVMATDRLVGIQTKKAGDFTLEMPHPGPWREVFSGLTLRQTAPRFWDAGVYLFQLADRLRTTDHGPETSDLNT